MMKKKGKKSNAQLIIDVLLTGRHLRSREISDMVSEAKGQEVKIQDIASMLSKLTDTNKCDLGFFIKRTKDDLGFVYHMVEEVLPIPADKVYGLARKIGKDRYTLEQAAKDHPKLKQYIGTSEPAKRAAKKKSAKAAVPAKSLEKKPAPMEVHLDDDVGKIVFEVIRKIANLEGMNVNINVSVNLEK
jgi:hypothetical protein